MSDLPTLPELDGALPFVSRHLGPDQAQVATMLERLGYPSLDALMEEAVPASIRTTAPLDLPAALSEAGVADELRSLAASNVPGEPMIGLGYHATITPPVVRRNVLEGMEDPSKVKPVLLTSWSFPTESTTLFSTSF